MDDLQFYPTPKTLARRAWGKFKCRDFSRVLEPSAGNGDLALMFKMGEDREKRRIDVIEMDFSKHPTLSAHGFNVVGYDFLKFKAGAIYSTCLMNPPFAEGVKHVLHAWEILEEAEIVAILNAETIKNPYSKERQYLVSLIEKHGEVEFIADAFNGPDAERRTDVEVALVWLKKESATMQSDIIGDILDQLKQDEASEFSYEKEQQVALPNSFIENTVRAYDAACLASREAIVVRTRASYYLGLLGESFTEFLGDKESGDKDLAEKMREKTLANERRMSNSKDSLRSALAAELDDIKDRAWTGILKSTQVTSKLSVKAQKSLHAQFEKIKKMEFSVSNIYGFLCGLADKQGEIQTEMACDVFDEITKYHTDNTVHYAGWGWKSNDKHRTCGMRIKTTRFILPRHGTDSWSKNLKWESERLLGDFDRVFALLDGKTTPDIGLVETFRNHFEALRNGQRVSASYFDVRYYPARGTIHFFPRSKNLVDRLNRLVGRLRQWLPPEGVKVPDQFWLQFDMAEKFEKDFNAELSKNERGYYHNPFWRAKSEDGVTKDEAIQKIANAMEVTLEKHGINPELLLEAPEETLGLPLFEAPDLLKAA